MQGLLVGLGTALLQAATALVVVGWVWSIMYVSLKQGRDGTDFLHRELYVNIYFIISFDNIIQAWSILC